MAGPQVWLAAKGASDTRLTYQPQTTYWKATYLRYTNWASETMVGTMTGSVRFGATLHTTLQRNADIADRTYIKVVMPKLVDNRAALDGISRDTPADQRTLTEADNVRYTNGIGFYLFEEIRCKIGGHEFDSYGSRAARILEDALTPERNRFRSLIGDFDTDADAFNQQTVQPVTPQTVGSLVPNAIPNETFTLYVPMYFWWSMLAHDKSIPLIALQNHQVSLEFRVRRPRDLITFTYPTENVAGRSSIIYDGGDPARVSAAVAAISNDGSSGSVLFNPDNLQIELLIDFVFLDTRERKAFSCKCLEYLIEQTQEVQLGQAQSGASSFTGRINFNHPVIFLAFHSQFVARRSELNQWDDWTGNRGAGTGLGILAPLSSNVAVDMWSTLTLRINNQMLFQPLDAEYLRLVTTADAGGFRPDLYYYMIPFCLDMHEHSVVGQHAKNPNGSMNFSRIDTVEINALQAVAATNTLNTQLYDTTGVDLLEDPSATTGTQIDNFCVARNYNYVKYAAGQAGLFYAN